MKSLTERSLAILDLSAYASASEDRIALIDSEGNIVGVNDKWLALAEQSNVVEQTGPGTNYLEVCRRATTSSQEAQEALSGIRAVLKGKQQSFTMDYASDHSPLGARYYRMGVSPIHYKRARFVIAHTDITELQLSKEKSLRRAQDFARRLINAQEEERERIAREIHDDLGNRIALLSFSVRQIAQRASHSVTSINELSQVIHHITDLSNALRNLAHCLHPPLLKHAGICVALKALCEEFEKAQGVQMDVVIPAELPPLPDEVGLCIFRVSQECLHNIAKHADADHVSVVLERTQRELRLRVADTGRGFVLSKNTTKRGLGLVSIKERVLCVKGRLKIQSAPGRGTEICVTIPLPQSKSG